MITSITPSAIKTIPLEFQLHDKDSVNLFVQSFNYLPFIYISKVNDPTNVPQISGTTIDPHDIIYVKLHNSKFLPEIELYCDDSKGILFNDLYPFDHDTIISIFIKSNSENIMPIRMDFRVTEYETIKSGDRNPKYLMRGLLDVDELHFSTYESRKGSSYDIIKQIALELKLGWASNVQSSNDKMTWINPGDTYKEFIKDITRYSYISEDAFIWTFIDFYYNLNYVNVQLELNQYTKSEQQSKANPLIVKNENEGNILLYLTNNNAFKGTNQHIAKFNIVNQSFKVNLAKFYKMKGTWYIKNTNTVIKKPLKELESDQEKLGPGEGALRQLADKKARLYDQNTNDEYFIGKMDTDSKHENYSLAKISNKFNLDNLQKMKMLITLHQVNFSIKRFQNIRIEIYNPDAMFSYDANTKTPLNNINTKLSGFWFVTGINYLYSKNGGIEQEITLMRRDLSINYGVGGDQQNDFRKIINTK